MTLLGKIRQKSWLLVGFIVIALASFLINPEMIEKMLGKDPNVLGEVNGEKITRQEYIETLNIMQQQAQQQGQSPNGLEEQAWQGIVQSKLIKQEFDKMGLKITEDLFWNQLPLDPMFSDDPNFKVADFKKEIEAWRTQDVDRYNVWLLYRREIENRIMARLLFSNISAGVTTNKKEVDLVMKYGDELADIDYVKIDYDEFLKKNPIKVSAQDLADYIKKYPATFKAPESRNLGIVYFKAEPTKDDEDKVLAEINRLHTAGINIGNGVVESFKSNKNDSLFVLSNSQIGFDPNYYPKEHLPQGIREQISSLSVGQTFGPYKEQDYFVVSKLLDKKVSDSIRSKHILISYQGLQTAHGDAAKRTKEEAKQLADKIANETKSNPAKFNDYLNLSADGSAQNGGDLGWRTTGQPGFVAEFQNYLDKSPKGAVDVVETQFGYHIINITDRKAGAMTYKVANLVKEVKPSEQTTNKIHSESNQFAQQIQGKSFNEFANLAKNKNFNFQNPKMVQRFQNGLHGLGTDKDTEILKWAFDKNRKKGDTEMFTTANGDRIIVYLNGKQAEGIVDPESIREQIEPIVKNNLLAKKIQEKINSSKATTLDQIAKLFGSSKEKAQINILNPILGMALEPKVAGAANGLAKGKVSKPIEGNTGVYVVMNNGISVNKQSNDAKRIQENLQQQYSSIFPQAYMRSLQNNAEIKDYRIEVYDLANAR